MPGNLVNLTPEVIAQWPKSNYIDPDQKTWATPTLASLYGVATFTLVLRYWVRYRKHGGGLGLDDAIMFCAWILSSGYTACAIISVVIKKSNRNMWDIPVYLWEGLAKMTAIAEIFYLFSGCCIRISVLLFYRRLVDETCSKRWRYAILAAIFFTASWVVACIFALVFSCTPIDAYWRSFDPYYTGSYQCIDIASLNYIVGTLTIVGDIYAAALPCLMTWNFRMPRAQRIGVNVVFGLCLAVVGVCCVRNYHLFRLSSDTNFSSVLLYIELYSQLELQLGIMCASAPALRILFRHYFKRPFSKIFSSWTDSEISGTGREDSVLHEMHDHEKNVCVDFQSALAGRWSSPVQETGDELQSPVLPKTRSNANVRQISDAENQHCNLEFQTMPDLGPS